MLVYLWLQWYWNVRWCHEDSSLFLLCSRACTGHLGCFLFGGCSRRRWIGGQNIPAVPFQLCNQPNNRTKRQLFFSDPIRVPGSSNGDTYGEWSI